MGALAPTCYILQKLLQLNRVHCPGIVYNSLMNVQTLSEIFGDRARLEGSIVVVRCSEEEEHRMLAKWLIALSFADELGRDWCGLGWSGGEVRMEAIEE